ncbi:hypothetical protein BDK51DRAFT_39984 [Blyttiomyces helicus]|uniref:Galactose oxidase n=1 Tax=Blyttiomyces helicus TaxID=388810 RepID=A0A4P9W6R1_9FUNG|nr:hypothetical protein BDK51DRAFT_39984 [Blyttiomyces helicus]|eukprot:RKO86420.1 hypothetical protein BDK51DRAFT_39984 [Blyttiomyces helicus]
MRRRAPFKLLTTALSIACTSAAVVRLPDAPRVAQPIPRFSAQLIPGSNKLVFLGGAPYVTSVNATYESLATTVTTLTYRDQILANVSVAAPKFNPLQSYGMGCDVNQVHLYCWGGYHAAPAETMVMLDTPLSMMNLKTLQWTGMRNVSLPALAYHTLTIVGDAAYVIGGMTVSLASPSLWEIPLSSGAPNATGTRLSVGGEVMNPVFGHCAALFGNDSILIFGGQGNNPEQPKQANANTFIFNTTTMKLASAAPFPALAPSMRTSSSCVSVNGDVWLFGGVNFVPDIQGYNDMWVFWRQNLSWTQVSGPGSAPGQPSIRWGASMAVADGNRFLVVSGDEMEADGGFFYFDLLTRQWMPPADGKSGPGFDLRSGPVTLPISVTTPSPTAPSPKASVGQPSDAIKWAADISVVVLCLCIGAIGAIVWARKRRKKDTTLSRKCKLDDDFEGADDLPPPSYDDFVANYRCDSQNDVDLIHALIRSWGVAPSDRALG